MSQEDLTPLQIRLVLAGPRATAFYQADRELAAAVTSGAVTAISCARRIAQVGTAMASVWKIVH